MSSGIEVGDQLAELLRPALGVAVVGLAVDVLGQGANPLSTTVSRVPAPAGSRVNST